MRRLGTYEVLAWMLTVAWSASAGVITTTPVGELDANGWTQFTESPDTVKVYVSNSSGSDTNPGTIDAPVKTIAKGKTLLRSGKPDWLLLKRGDTWNETLGAYGISGRSPSEPQVVMPYGTGPRPILVVASGSGVGYTGTAPAKHIAITGIHFKKGTPDDTAQQPAVRWLGPVENLLFEDLYMEGEGVIQATNFGDIANIALRRCLIVDCWNPDKVQGLFIQRADGILLEENVFDNNGYLNPTGAIGSSIIVNHNVYIQKDCARFVARGNISMRAPSHGMQARVGGTMDNNLFINNAFGFVHGIVEAPVPENGVITRNVVMDGKDIPRSGADTLYRAWGIELHGASKAHQTIVADNVIVNEFSQALEAGVNDRPKGISLSGGTHNVEIARNVTYNWRRPLIFEGTQGLHLSNINVHDNIFYTLDNQRSFVEMGSYSDFRSLHTFARNTYFSTLLPANQMFQLDNATKLSLPQWVTQTGEDAPRNTDPQFVDSTRNIQKYMESLGFPATFEAFIAEVRKQSKATWRPELSAPVINDWIREGFTPAGGTVQPTGDTTPPNPGTLSPSSPGTNQPSITINYSGASDNAGGSGFNNIRLWFKKGDSGTWKPFGTVLTTPLGTFTFNGFSSADTYYFASRAQDNAGNYSAVPTGNGTASIQYAPPPARLVLDAKLDDTPSDGVLDSSAFANHGTAVGAALPAVSTGNIGSAYAFNGTDQYVNFSAVADEVAATLRFTVSVWIKTPGVYTTALAPGAILGINTSSGGNCVVLFIGNAGDAADDNTYVVMDGGSLNATEGKTGVIVADDTWHHIAYTSDNAVGRLYIDGVLRSTHEANFALSATDQWSIGQEFDNATKSNFMSGLMDELKVWDGALSDADIATVFAGGIPNAGDTTAPSPGTANTPPSVNAASIPVSYTNAADNPGGTGLNNVRLWAKKESGGTWVDTGMILFSSSGTFNYPGAIDPATYFFALQAQDNAGNKSTAPAGDSAITTSYTPPPPTLVFHGRFDDDPADGVLDSSNGNNHGTCPTGSAPALSTSGKVGSAYNFDGINDYVIIDSVADDIAQSQKFSVAMWVRIPNIYVSTTGMGALLGVNNTANISGGNTLIITAGTNNAADNNELALIDGGNGGAAYEAQTNTIIADNNWHHIVYTSQGVGGTGKFYVDGVQKSSHPVNYVFSASDLWSVGQEWDSTATSNHIKNLIDEVKIWNGVLSATDVQAVFNGQDLAPAEDTTAPGTGSISAPPFAKTAPIAINYSGVVDAGGSGLKEVRLWAKKDSGGTWIDTGVVSTSGSGTLNFTGVSGDGDYFFALQAIDNADNASAAPSGSGMGSTKFDATAPAAASVTAPAMSGNATLSLTYGGASDAGSGVKSVVLWVRKGAAAWASTGLSQTAASGGFTFNTSGDATYFFATQVEDSAGNFSPVPSGNGSASTLLDTTAPTAAAVVAPEFAKTAPISLSYSGAADAGSGLKRVLLWARKDAGAWSNTGLSQTTASGSFSFTPVGDGQYFFATQAEDNAGKLSPAPSGNGSDSTIFDTQVPVAAALSGPSATKSSPIALTFSGASDSGSGVKSVRLWSRKNGGAWTDTGQSATGASGSFSFTHSGDGAYNFATQVEDNATNVSAVPSGSGSLTVTVDSTAPQTGTMTSTQSTNSSPISVSYSGVSDSLSGLKRVNLWFKKDTGAWSDSGLSQTAGTGSFSYSPSGGSGSYHFAVVAEDNASNVSTTPSGDGTTVTVYDVVQPTKGSAKRGGGGKSALPGFASTSPIVVTYDGASDQHSGLKEVQLWARRNNGLWANTGLTSTGATGSFNYPVTLGDGQYQFTTVSEDKAANKNSAPTGEGDFSVMFDSVKPVPGTATSPSFTKTSPITVNYSGASDQHSGLQFVKLWVSKDGAAWTDTGLTQTTASGSFSFSGVSGDGVYRFDLQAEDKAGMLSDAPSGTGDCSTTLDNTAPSPGNLSAPATEDGMPIPVTFSGVSDGSGSGVKSVYLWFKKGDAGTWTNSGQSANGESGDLYFSGATGDDTYFFALQTEDKAGNISPEPSVAQASTVLNTSFTPGTATSPPYLESGPIPVTYEGANNSNGTGLASIHLYFKKGESGAWTDSGLRSTGASGTFEFTDVTGDDAYYFATRAEDDNGALTQAPAGGGDTKTFVDSTPPEPGTLTSPQYANVQQIKVAYTGVTDDVSGVKTIKLWVKQGAEGEWQDSGLTATESDGEFDYGPVDVEETYTFYLQSENNAGGKNPEPTDDIVFGTPPSP